ncbi:flagellum-specific peptidoglycan hydrolase FlgJ [Ulvibacter antarcticus]|uniref:Peptidoglycan hydrolase n=2 Tax=Ulvibacter antarcticus TaxID=442714 RepID=A0A3L9YAD9_9FLAO|nr:flagellum-specific peptidoglycan hydrolase FlgJ [Ulvibacter antarcticus]
MVLSGCKSHKKTTTYKKKTRTERTTTPVINNTSNPKDEETVTIVTPPKTNASYAEIVSNYINNYSGIAMEEMLQYGIPASITLAQGILESGAGRGELTSKANNHFGIKCHREWSGDRVYHDDDEAQECFRKYADPKYSFRDHSLFLTSRSRYADLFKLRKDDYKAWSKGLKKAGYATDPKYPDKLIGIIERYNLTSYDDEVLGGKVNTVRLDDTKISTYQVQKGDTLYNIARRHNITVETLKEYNGLRSNDISIGQELYLHPVKN